MGENLTIVSGLDTSRGYFRPRSVGSISSSYMIEIGEIRSLQTTLLTGDEAACLRAVRQLRAFSLSFANSPDELAKLVAPLNTALRNESSRVRRIAAQVFINLARSHLHYSYKIAIEETLTTARRWEEDAGVLDKIVKALEILEGDSKRRPVRLRKYDSREHDLCVLPYLLMGAGGNFGAMFFGVNKDVVAEREQVFAETGENLDAPGVTDSPFPPFIGPLLSLNYDFGIVPFRRAGLEFGFSFRFGFSALPGNDEDDPITVSRVQERVILDYYGANMSSVFYPSVHVVAGWRGWRKGYVGGLRLELGFYRSVRKWGVSYLDEQGETIKRSMHNAGGVAFYFMPAVQIPVPSEPGGYLAFGVNIPLSPHECKCGYGFFVSWGARWPMGVFEDI